MFYSRSYMASCMFSFVLWIRCSSSTLMLFMTLSPALRFFICLSKSVTSRYRFLRISFFASFLSPKSRFLKLSSLSISSKLRRKGVFHGKSFPIYSSSPSFLILSISYSSILTWSQLTSILRVLLASTVLNSSTRKSW